VHAGEHNMTRLALVGCGGRGTGAVGDALSTTGGPVQLYAMADLFGDRLQSSLKTLSIAFKDKIDVTSERCFLGFDAYKKAIDCLSPGDVVLLTTHAAFRPMMFEYAVKKGVNVFMEKSFAPDAPNTRRLLAAAAESERKNHSHADDPRFDPGGQEGELNRLVEREELYEHLAAIWANSSSLLNRLCSDKGMRYYRFLQPNQYLPGSKPISEAEKHVAIQVDHPYRQGVEMGYPLLIRNGRALKEQGIPFYDLTGIFGDHPEAIYIDSCCHSNQVGLDLMAQAIAHAILDGHPTDSKK
jgi:hypothetical protein